MQIEALMMSLKDVQSLQSNLDFSTIPTVPFGVSLTDLKLPDNTSPYLSLVDSENRYRGIVRVQDILFWQNVQLEKKNLFLERVNDFQPCCILVINGRGQLEYFNKSAACNFSLQFPYDLEILPGFSYIRDILKQKKFQDNLKELEVSAGKVKYLVTITPVYAENILTRLIVTYRNVASMKFYVILQSIFNHMHDGVNIVDENGILTYSNPSSARYAGVSNPIEMIGQPVKKYYPLAVLLQVIKDKKSYFSEQRRNYPDRIYVTSAVPLYIDGVFKGGIAIFRDISEIKQLIQRISTMQNTLQAIKVELSISKNSNVFDGIIGSKGSLKATIDKAQRCIAALGGPRHCVITGETGTGKTLLARAMYQFAKRIGIIASDAPFIEVNCAQFTNPDIAAMEIFGSDKGAFTGAQDKQRLLEQANNGIFFLDEAHALGPYQTILLKVIEDGLLRRIGGRTYLKTNIIIIAASTKDLKTALIPELYQRLAQYQISLPPLGTRPYKEKKALMNVFFLQYEEVAKKHYGINLVLTIDDKAEKILLNTTYPHNIRQFRNIINISIDAALPLVSSIEKKLPPVLGVVKVEHLPADLLKNNVSPENYFSQENSRLYDRVSALHRQGFGARKIAKLLVSEGMEVKYYQVTYILQKLRHDLAHASVQNINKNQNCVDMKS